MRVTLPGSPLPLDSISKRLRLVIFECPYDTIENPIAQSLLGKIARMKITGYKAEYPYGATPVDTGDFVGTHLLLCEELRGGDIEPIMGFKSLSYRRCQIHELEFPAFHLFPKEDHEKHRRAVESLLDEAERNGEETCYNGSWTVRQDLRSDRTLIQLCYDVTLLLLVRYYTDYRIQNVLAGATVRFKVHRFKEFMGWEYVESDGNRLATFPCKPFFNEEVALMRLRKFSPEAHALAERYRFFWEQRLTVSAVAEEASKKAA